ncbi:MAG: surface-adhesin E family protein [Nitrospiraceae bacterium]
MSFMIVCFSRFFTSGIRNDGAGPLGRLPAAYALGFWILIALLILGYSPAHAGWVTVEKRFQTLNLQTVYFDPDTIRRESDLATLWQLADIKWIDGAPTPRFLSAKTHKQFDCPRLRFRLLAIVEYSRQMATGKSWSGYIENGNWQTVEAQSVNHALWEAACKKK